VVRYGQVGNEFLAKIADLPGGYRNVALGQMCHYLLFGPAVDKKGVSNVNKDIVPERAAMRCQITQLLTMVDAATGVLQDRLFGAKRSDIHGDNGFSRLLSTFKLPAQPLTCG